MFDRYLLPLQHRLLAAPARWLAARGVSADALTLSGFAIGMAAVALVSQRLYGVALVCIGLNRLLDGLDGAVARLNGATDRGAFLDIALDFFFYAAVPFGFALADPAANALAAATLLLSFIGTSSSFLTFSALAAKRGLVAPAFPNKGIYYLGGLTEAGETIAAFAAMCLWPVHFAAIAWVFAALAFVTTLLRWRQGWALLGA